MAPAWPVRLALLIISAWLRAVSILTINPPPEKAVESDVH
jgi:hypothetical protein